MAIESGFFNSIEITADDGSKTYDREYYAIDFANYLNKVVGNGVFATPSNNLQILASTGMDVVVKEGEGRINGYWVRNTNDYTITINQADVILNRIDRIVMQLNHENRQIDIVYKVGELATDPVAPELVRTEQIEEYSLARIYVGKNVTTIYQSNITDTRPLEDECGLIATLGTMESNNYFIQMQDYVDRFMSTKSAEFNSWEEAQQAAFDSWFNDIQDNVKATSLYREYQAVYRSNVSGQNVITIPTSINYVHNSLDVLNVFINGMRLLKDIEYTISSDGTEITLATPLDVATQDVEFVNKKSVDGAPGEEVVNWVEQLDAKVNGLINCTYIAGGWQDNILLSDIVKNFLDGISDTGIIPDNASMKLNVSGELHVNSLIDEQSIFDFSTTTDSNRTVILDFGNATITTPDSPETTQSIFAVFNMGSNVVVENANILINSYNADTIYIVHGGTLRNSKIYLSSSATEIYGVWGAVEVSNSKIDINPTNTESISYGVYQTKKTVLNDINLSGSGLSMYSISAGDNQLLLGNIVNAIILKTDGTVEIGTVGI